MDPSSLHLLYEAHSLVSRADAGNSTSTTTPERPPAFKAVGITLALVSGLLIGSSFPLKKFGLLRANKKYNQEAGEGFSYLKNAYWWGGMALMIMGEICNFVAYMFIDAIVVATMGTLSVVVSTVLSAIFLKERLSFVGKVGCFNCIIGSIVIVLNTPPQSTVADIEQMKDYVLHPGILTYGGIVIVGCIIVAVWVAPKYGKKSMLVYITICSMIGGLSVVAIQGLGGAILAQAAGKPQFNQWFTYVLLVFVTATLLTEIVYLNKALNLFNAALVTPTYYVYFTTATIVTSAILFRGFNGTAISITTIVLTFLQICAGVILLQLSKSAKDVPDAAVFKGDLDQVREIAQQEQPETEPKADAIRGAAALIRHISNSRAKMEQAEFRRLQEEKTLDQLEPLKENEVVEWDGLRRRKTIIGDASVPGSPMVRRKTIHPPLGMSRFPDPEEEAEEEERQRAHTHGGILQSLRHRASSILHPLTPRPPGRERPQSPMYPVALTDIQVHPSKADSPLVPYDSGDREQAEHGYGLPVTLSQSNREAKPIPSPRSKPLPDKPASSPLPLLSPPHTGARRQFSFTNFLHRGSRTATPVDGANDLPLPPPRAGLGSRGSNHGYEQKKAMKNATEEERLGLVKGDSYRALLDSSPERPHVPRHPSARRARSGSESSNSEIEDDEEFDGRYEPTSLTSRSRSTSQPQSRGRHDDVYYSQSRNSDSDGYDGWQMTTSPSDPTTPKQQPPQVRNLSQQAATPQQPRPSSRKRPSPPRNYPAPVGSQSTIPTGISASGPTPAVPNLSQGPRLHFRAASTVQGGVERPGPSALRESSRSRNLSMSQSHVRMVSQDHHQDQDRNHSRDPTLRTRSEATNATFGTDLRREQSPEGIEEMGLGVSVTSKKRYELQSAREREERRKRMSSGWSNPNVQGGSNGSSPPTGFI